MQNAGEVPDSYLRHKEEEQSAANKNQIPWCYGDPNTIGNWHHQRMLGSLLPLLKSCKDASWVTIGDGRFGSDAHFLRHHVRLAIATSISGSTLRLAKERGWIDEFSEENAERLSFADKSFDYVLCKETYHHFPRPAIGFYEMLRVSKLGVVLIEPMEDSRNPLLPLKRTAKKWLRGDHSYDLFEPSGNFVFRINIRDVEKMMTALGYMTLAWKGMNTFWHAPFDSAEQGKLSYAWLGSRVGILVQDFACWCRLATPGIATVIC